MKRNSKTNRKFNDFSTTFEIIYKFMDFSRAWNFIFQIPGLFKDSMTCGDPELIIQVLYSNILQKHAPHSPIQENLTICQIMQSLI